MPPVSLRPTTYPLTWACTQNYRLEVSGRAVLVTIFGLRKELPGTPRKVRVEDFGSVELIGFNWGFGDLGLLELRVQGF